MRRYAFSLLTRAVFLAFLAAGAAHAADDAEKGWHDTAEFGAIATSGNTESVTLGLKEKLWWVGDRSNWELRAGGIRTRTITQTFAVGTPSNYSVRTEKDVTSENYYVNSRYGRKISEKFFWFVAGSWDKNEFAGIRSRYTGIGGVGNQWLAREDHTWRTDYSATYTKQNNVVDDPDFNEKFAGLRVSSAYMKKLGSTTTYTNDFAYDANLKEGKDWRADMTNSVSVAMSTNLALKVSYQSLYDNDPSLREIDLYDGNPPNANKIGTVKEDLDSYDGILTASVVVNF